MNYYRRITPAIYNNRGHAETLSLSVTYYESTGRLGFTKNWKTITRPPYERLLKSRPYNGFSRDDLERVAAIYKKTIEGEMPTLNDIKFLFTIPAQYGDSWEKIAPIEINADEMFSILEI